MLWSFHAQSNKLPVPARGARWPPTTNDAGVMKRQRLVPSASQCFARRRMPKPLHSTRLMGYWNPILGRAETKSRNQLSVCRWCASGACRRVPPVTGPKRCNHQLAPSAQASSPLRAASQVTCFRSLTRAPFPIPGVAATTQMWTTNPASKALNKLSRPSIILRCPALKPPTCHQMAPPAKRSASDADRAISPPPLKRKAQPAISSTECFFSLCFDCTPPLAPTADTMHRERSCQLLYPGLPKGERSHIMDREEPPSALACDAACREACARKPRRQRGRHGGQNAKDSRL